MADMKPEQLGETLSAYLDGELDAIETAKVDQLLRDDRSVREQLTVLQRTVKLARSLPRHGAPSTLALPTILINERSIRVVTTPPHPTPRTPSTSARVIGCLYAIMASVSMPAFDRRCLRRPE